MDQVHGGLCPLTSGTNSAAQAPTLKSGATGDRNFTLPEDADGIMPHPGLRGGRADRHGLHHTPWSARKDETFGSAVPSSSIRGRPDAVIRPEGSLPESFEC